MTEAVSAPTQENQATPAKAQTNVEFANCDCCGLTEECTPTYIDKVRQRYQGKWICGLFAEAIKDEIIRTERLISTEEAMVRHMNFCRKFVSS
ncbi:Mono-/di-acylglycerol lipase isoform 1 [Hibiscus syriacus]|uniref:Mono-/di-acylglycerol lipase isoform 1 n=1 Tax=Hibiscus syriacus TaxID=106335 RepID=A0A6A2ZZ87_HIBSY|nr:Mono-/di-acylglycerol lipase isoform 1 [Hibiscus syriacus]